MDAFAIKNASHELLKEMGLSKAGDRLSVKRFCAHQEDNSPDGPFKDRKRALLEAFLSQKKEKNKAKRTLKKKEKKSRKKKK